jgi:hypothetical protein
MRGCAHCSALHLCTLNRKCEFAQNSEFFFVKNGVKQGGILSPSLFSIYTKEMLENLRKTGLGCHIGITFVGALAYADDIIILAPLNVP